MDEKPTTEQPNPLRTNSETAGDPDAGQVVGPDGEAPVDPAAKALYRGCLIVLLFVAIAIGVFSLLYRFVVAA